MSGELVTLALRQSMHGMRLRTMWIGQGTVGGAEEETPTPDFSASVSARPRRQECLQRSYEERRSCREVDAMLRVMILDERGVQKMVTTVAKQAFDAGKRPGTVNVNRGLKEKKKRLREKKV
jgi:hypothetical protein